MSISNTCRTAIKSAAPELSDLEVDGMVKQVTSKVAELRRAQKAFADDPSTILEAIAKITADEKIAAIIEKRSRAISVLKKKERFAFYDQNPKDGAGALKAITTGKEGSADGWGRSTEALIYAEQDRLVSPLNIELEKANLMREFGSEFRQNREFHLAVAKEMSRLNGGVETPTGNPKALQAAEILNKYIGVGLERRNAAGAWTRKLPGYIVTQSHNPQKITKIGQEEWRRDFESQIDKNETLADVENTPEAIDAFHKNQYTRLSTGVHLKAGESDWLGGFKGGSSNLAKRASQERSIHFKDATAWFEYNEKYGAASLLETVHQHLMNVGRDVALMKVWGPNPRAAFDADRKLLLDRAIRANDTAQIEALSGKTMEGKRILAGFEQIDGSANIVENAALATWGRNIRGVETITKLTNGILSQFSDLFGRAATMRWNGMNPFEAHGQSIAALLKGRPDLEQREILHRIGSYGDGIVGDIAARVQAGDTLDGRMSKAVRWSQIINMQRWWTDIMAAQTTRDIASTLGFYKDTALADLPDRLKITLGRYGITEAHWNYARANTLESNGRHLTVSDAIRYEADDVVKSMMGKADATPTEVARFRDDFEQTWRTYYIDQAREAITDPGAMTRASVTQGLAPGSITGEGMRFIMQFKSFPLAFIHKHVNREMNRGGSVDISGLMQMFLGMTAAGYLSDSVKDLVKNKTPKTADDPADFVKLFANAVSKGGGLGILGDVLFNDYASGGRGNIGNLLGPTAGSAGELLAMAQAAFSEGTGVKDSNLSARGLNILNSYMPLVNTWYTKAAWETLVLHGLQESVNPGYMARQQRKMERGWGQSYIMPPSVW